MPNSLFIIRSEWVIVKSKCSLSKMPKAKWRFGKTTMAQFDYFWKMPFTTLRLEINQFSIVWIDSSKVQSMRRNMIVMSRTARIPIPVSGISTDTGDEYDSNSLNMCWYHDQLYVYVYDSFVTQWNLFKKNMLRIVIQMTDHPLKILK